jgi:hypothetical protein
MPTIDPITTVGTCGIATPTLSDNATIIQVGSEIGSLPAANTRLPNLRPDVWRTTGGSATVVFDLGEGNGRWNMISLLGIDATPHNNLLQSSIDLSDTTYWTQEAATVALAESGDPFGGGEAWSITDTTATSRHRIYQYVTRTPDTDSSPTSDFNFSVWAKSVGAGLENVILKVESEDTSHYITCKYDLVTQVVSFVENGDFTNGTVSIANDPPGSDWYRCSMSGNSDTSPILFPSIMVSNAAGDESYTGSGAGFDVFFYGPQLEIGRTSTGDYASTTTDSAARIRIFADTDMDTVLTSKHNSALNTGLMPLIPEPGDFSDWESLSSLYWSDTSNIYRYVRIEILDYNNLNGYLDVGRIYIADGWQVEINPHPGFLFPAKVSGRRRTETISGRRQLRDMRGRKVCAGQLTITDTEEAMKRYLELARQVSMSGDVLFITDPKGAYTMRGMLYGAFEELDAPSVINRGYYKIRFKLEEL